MFNGQYGNSLSFYGNIELGVWSQAIQPYGAWPYDEPANSPMLNNIPLAGDIQAAPIVNVHDDSISTNIAIIKRLKAELAETEEVSKRQLIRLQMQSAREEKERAFKMKARIDEEESLFILLH